MLTGPSSAISLVGVMYLLYIFGVLSRKLGAVTKMKPYYRGFYWAMGLIGIAIIAEWVWLTTQVAPALSASSPTAVPYLITYDVPLALAATLSVVVALRYWSWLFKERGR